MSREVEKAKEGETHNSSRDLSVQNKPEPDNNVVKGQDTASKSGIDKKDRPDKKLDLEYNFNKDGTVGLSFEFKRRYDLAARIGKIGGLLVTAGAFISIIAPILFVTNIIPTLSFMLALMTSPFGVGAGLITLSKNFEYFPGV